jgi:hypothetical protein
MDRVEIPQDQVVSMDNIAPAVQGLRITFVNVFGVAHQDGSWTLIDAGLPFSDGFISRWAEKVFKKAPNAIVLSHGHFDHVSAAADLADHWNIPIYAHAIERPYLTGKKEYPPPNTSVGGGIMPIMAPLFPRGPIDLRERLKDFPNSSTTIWLCRRCQGGKSSTRRATHPATFLSFVPRTARYSPSTLSVPPSRSHSLKRISRKKGSCTGRRHTLPPTGTARVLRCNISQRCNRSPSRPDTVDPYLALTLRRNYVS